MPIRSIKPFAIALSIIVAAVAGLAVWSLYTQTPQNVACTMEAKLCPDGSYVGRSGPRCEFAPCPGSPEPVPAPVPDPGPGPGPYSECTSDAECSPNATCQAIMGTGTVSPDGGTQEYRITQGECKLKEGASCGNDAGCLAGLVCHSGICTSPRDGICGGPDDTSCQKGYRCIQSCGPPVARNDDPPPPWYCEVDEVAARPKICPICLASTTEISTPDGPMKVKDMREGMNVWSSGAHGERVKSTIVAVSRTAVPSTHRMIRLVLSDGREARVSPGHPTADGRSVQDLRTGDAYDGAFVRSAELVPYQDGYTYDILPAAESGRYWANGILFGSTLARPASASGI